MKSRTSHYLEHTLSHDHARRMLSLTRAVSNIPTRSAGEGGDPAAMIDEGDPRAVPWIAGQEN
jgi:hypothetical protein